MLEKYSVNAIVAQGSEAGMKNNTDFMSLWAGQNTYLCKN